MTQEPKLKLYLVALGFAKGVSGASVVPAFREADAAAVATANILNNSTTKPELPLTHVYIQEVTAEQLKMLLRVLETGKTDAEVVPLSIVPQAPPLEVVEKIANSEDLRMPDMPRWPDGAA